MKTLTIGLVLLSSCAVSAFGAVFQMDRKGDATVEIVEAKGEYKVTCRFSPQKKFSSAINAKFNDNKGDSLCKKGIARYLNASPEDTVSVSGMYSAAPVKTVDGKLCYSFGVPIDGCHVHAAAAKPKKTSVPAMPVAKKSVPTSAVEPVDGQAVIAKKLPSEKNYACVTTYREVNGHRTVVSQREYRGSSFNSTRDFDRFCQDELARIRALGEKNLHEVRELGK